MFDSTVSSEAALLSHSVILHDSSLRAVHAICHPFYQTLRELLVTFPFSINLLGFSALIRGIMERKKPYYCVTLESPITETQSICRCFRSEQNYCSSVQRFRQFQVQWEQEVLLIDDNGMFVAWFWPETM